MVHPAQVAELVAAQMIQKRALKEQRPPVQVNAPRLAEGHGGRRARTAAPAGALVAHGNLWRQKAMRQRQFPHMRRQKPRRFRPAPAPQRPGAEAEVPDGAEQAQRLAPLQKHEPPPARAHADDGGRLPALPASGGEVSGGFHGQHASGQRQRDMFRQGRRRAGGGKTRPRPFQPGKEERRRLARAGGRPVPGNDKDKGAPGRHAEPGAAATRGTADGGDKRFAPGKRKGDGFHRR